MKRISYLVLTVCAILQLTACVTGAQAPGMTVLDHEEVIEANPEFIKQIEVGEVSGGKQTNPLWRSNISTDEFRIALQSSLISFRYLSDEPSYQLTAKLIEVTQPGIGLSHEVSATVEYLLTELETGSVIYDETITTSHTTDFDDSGFPAKQRRLANEGAIKANIEKFLTDIWNRHKQIEQGQEQE